MTTLTPDLRYNSSWVATLPTTLTLYFRKKEIIEKHFGGKQKISNNIFFRYDVFYLIYVSLVLLINPSNFDQFRWIKMKSII